MNDASRLEAPRLGPEGHDPFWDDIGNIHYFDRRGNPLTLREWTMLCALKQRYRVLKQEYVGEYWVSTVWLGLDHGFGDGAPLIFETMVFDHSQPGRESLNDLDMQRYSTEQQALAGHQDVVAKVRLFVAFEKGEPL